MDTRFQNMAGILITRVSVTLFIIFQNLWHWKGLFICVIPGNSSWLFYPLFLFFLVWPLFSTHSRCRGLFIAPNHPRWHTHTHTHTPQSVGLLWTSDHPIPDTSTWQHTTLTRNIHAPGRVWTCCTCKWVVTDPDLILCSHWMTCPLLCHIKTSRHCVCGGFFQ